MLRNQIPEEMATYADPVLGVNLNSAQADLKPGEAALMQNCVYYAGTQIRSGSVALNSSSLGAYNCLGGHKYYYGGSVPKSLRVVAYNTNIVSLSDAGVQSVLTSSMTAGKDTHFVTWPITDRVYVSNGTDQFSFYDGNISTFESVSSIAGYVNVPGMSGNPASRMCAPILDRLMCITTNGIERTNARVDNIWSLNSPWATMRPIKGGLFTALASYTMRGLDALYPGIIAFQADAFYLITGTEFGVDVTAASASGDNGSIQLLDPKIGTSSPYSVKAVPGVGLFWFTSDKNVYMLPEGALSGRLVGTKLISTGAAQGIESVNLSALGQVWMEYFYPYLMLGVPLGSNTYATTQFWLDIRQFFTAPQTEPVWYGPMTGQSVGRCWAETQNSDSRVIGGEGNSANGLFVYNLRQQGTFTDAVGTSNNAVAMNYLSYFQDFGYPSRGKYVQNINADLYMPGNTATCQLYDLTGALGTATNFVALS